VREVLAAFEAELGRPMPHRLSDRRSGDVATLLADPGAAEQRLGWRAQRGLAVMVRDAWRWAGAAQQWGLWDEEDPQNP
jgi:UDP-glucose 4-epimerase